MTTVDEVDLVLHQLAEGEIGYDQARARLRPCFCPTLRWERWRDGIEAGPDHELNTADDIDLEAEQR